MTQSDSHTPTSEAVSTVTKHIKLYSDNPIHDCIDRIIEACADLDADKPNPTSYLIELGAAADQLEALALETLKNIIPTERAKRNAEKSS